MGEEEGGGESELRGEGSDRGEGRGLKWKGGEVEGGGGWVR